MSGSLEPFTRALNVLKDTPLWLLIGSAGFLLLFPLFPGASDLLSSPWPGLIRLAGIFFAILAACHVGSVLAPDVRAWWAEREGRRTLYLTLNDNRSFWQVSKQQDGSMVTQFALHFMAKNRTSAPLHLLKVRVIRPRVRGEALTGLVFVRDVHRNVYGSAEVNGSHIPADGLLPVSANILIRGTPTQKEGKLKTIVGIADENGNETRATFNLRHSL
jgi:hypothetical protein